MFAYGAAEYGAADAVPDDLLVWSRLASGIDRPVWAVSWEALKPGAASKEPGYTYGDLSYGEWSSVPGAIEEGLVYRASTSGYVSRPTDAEGAVLWPPLLRQAVSVDRLLGLEPWSGGAGLAWGDVEIDAPDGTWDADVEATNTDGRAVTVYVGSQTYDPARGLWRDPSSRSLAVVFAGLAGDWSLDEQTLRLPVRDWSVLLERPWVSNVYTGAGGAEGTAELAGTSKPRLRGTAREITPVLIDPTNRVYQWTDGPGELLAVYERGYAGFTDAGDFADYAALIAAPLLAGQYASAEAEGLFRLGTTPTGTITVDARGSFPAAGYKSRLADIARYILLEDMGLPPSAASASAFYGLSQARPWTGGIWDGEGRPAVEIVARVLRSLGCRLLPGRLTGRLQPYVVTAPGAVPAVATLTEQQIIRAQPVDLPAGLSPPPYRIRVGYDRRYTTQTGDLSSSLTVARLQDLAREWSTAVATAPDVLTQFRNPSDQPLIETCLDTPADADALAAAMVDVWGTRRWLYDLDVPVAVGMPFDLGQGLVVRYPLGVLRGGAPVVIVGQSLRSAEDIVTLRILA